MSVIDLVKRFAPRHIVELGTGDGMTVSGIMDVLRPDARLTTVNWPNPPSGDNPHRYLEQWLGDPRLTLIRGDTRNVADQIEDGIDFLSIDSTHTYACAMAEWLLYQQKLVDGAVVAVDDLNHGDMQRFWDEIPFEKHLMRDGCAGWFVYRSSNA